MSNEGEKKNEINIGAELKRLRLEKNITLEQVHKHTKIHPSVLKNLEESQLSDINPVYVKGFIKIYCRFLGIDPAAFIQSYDRVKVIPHSQLKSPEPSFLSELKMKISSLPSVKLKKIKKIVIIILCLLFILVAFKLLRRKPSLAVQEKLPPVKTAVNKVNLVSETIKVVVRAKQDCWIKATADGKVVYQAILKKDRFESWNAQKQIELSLGNAGGLELEINGKLFSPLGRRGQVIKRVLINKDGLKILK